MPMVIEKPALIPSELRFALAISSPIVCGIYFLCNQDLIMIIAIKFFPFKNDYDGSIIWRNHRFIMILTILHGILFDNYLINNL